MEEALTWRFDPLARTDPNGRNPIFGNFKNEGYSDCQTFVREYLQNALDNRRQKAGSIATAHVVFRLIDKTSGLDTGYLKKLMSSLEPHLVASGLPADRRDYENARVLIVEEYETTGFGGTYDDSRAEGDFAGFFHGEANDTKIGGKNGRAGQGKATYNMISHGGAFWALTLREEDNLRLLMGKALVPKTHPVGGRHYKFRGFWSDWIQVDGDQQPCPVLDADAQDRMVEAFGLKRGPSDYGSSFVIPFPKAEVTEALIRRVILEEYFYSIIKGRLQVQVGDTAITTETVFDLVNEGSTDTQSGHQAPSMAFMQFVQKAIALPDESRCDAVKAWDGQPLMPADQFSPECAIEMSQQLASGEIVWARLPITVSPHTQSKKQGFIEVFLRQSEEIERTEEAFIRRDLYIAKERHVRGIFGQTHVLVIADEETISGFLAYAEVASHLNWNGSEEKLTERYSVGATLRAVRNSALRLLGLLQGAEEEVSTDLLIDLLSVPLDSGDAKGKQAGGDGKTRIRPEKPDRPEPTERFHKIADGKGVRVECGPDRLPALPIAGVLELAYENTGLGGNPFTNYHPFDFDLYDAVAHKLTSNGVSLQSRSENTIRFTINEPEWFLEIEGFDPDKPIRARAMLEV